MSSTKYKGTLNGRGRVWTFELMKAGATLVSDDHDIALNSALQWGQNTTTGFFDQLIKPASLTLAISDPGSIIFDDLRTSSQFAFTLRITDSTQTYQMDLFVKLADAFTPLDTTTQIPTTRLIAFCGLTRLKDLDVDTTLNIRTLHGLVKTILADTLREQDILYTFGWRAARVSSSQPLVQCIRFNDLTWEYSGTDQDPLEVEKMGDQLTDICEGFQVEVFMDLHYGGRWRVAQPWLNGLAISEASRLGALYDASAATVADVAHAAQLKTLVVDDATMRGLFEPLQAVRFEIGKALEAVTGSVVNKGPLSEGWISANNNAFWEESDTAIFHQTSEGAYIDDGGENVLQRCVLLEAGKPARIEWTFDYALEYTPAGAGTHQIEFQILAVPLDPTVATQYSDAVNFGEWTTTPTTLQDSVARTPDANGTLPGSLTWRNMLATVEDTMPFDGYIVVKIFGDTGTDYLHHIREEIRVELRTQTGIDSPIPPWPARVQAESIGLDTTEGAVARYNRPWHPFQVERDSSDFTAMTVDVNISQFEECNQWEGVETDAAGPYWDLNELTGRVRLLRQSGYGRLIRGRYDGILTPGDAISALGTRFLVVYLAVDLHTETTRMLLYENLVDTSI